MKKEMTGAESTNKKVLYWQVPLHRMFGSENDTNVIDDEIYVDIEGHFRRPTQVNVLQELLKETGLDCIDFCYIYNCSYTDLDNCLSGTIQRLPPKLIQAILRAWSDFRFINNDYTKWVCNKRSETDFVMK